MGSSTDNYGFIPYLPKDYFRRRRAIRRIANATFMLIFSVLVAYVITRPVGGKGFSIPKAAKGVLTQNSTGNLAAISSSSAAEAFRDAAPAQSSLAGYELKDGPFKVREVSDIVLHDARRNKDLHLRVFFPESRGKFPVIVFSHGAGGSQTCCESLTRHWATYGYITLQPTHDDSAVQRRNAGEENIRFMQAVRDALKDPALWESRPQDISFVLDSLPALEKRIPALAGIVDTEHIGVAGHSMGSYTAEVIAGARVELPNHPAQNFADSRVKAVICLSPQGPGQFGLSEHSFDQVRVPFLGITGSLDSLGPVASPAWHKTPFERSEAGNKYHILIQGADHMSFISARTVLPGRAAQGDAILSYTNSASMAFWDAYLKNDVSAKKYLDSDALAQSSHGQAILSRR